MGPRGKSQEPTPNSQRDAIENWELEEVLDQALSQLNSGDRLEEILDRYPAHPGLLRPMLRAAQLIRRVPPPVPDSNARQAGLNRLLAAVEALQRKEQGRERLLSAVAGLQQTQFELRRSAHEATRPESITSQVFQDALDEALAGLRNGADVETVLARYPAFAAQMRPLLETAEHIRQVPPPVPDEAAYFAGRAQIVRLAVQQRRLRQMARTPARLAGTTRVALTQFVSRMLTGVLGVAPHMRRATITVTLLAVMILGSFSAVRVAADSLPTSPLYPVKRFTERMQLVLTPSVEAKARLHLQFSQERLRETEAMAQQTGQVDSKVLGDMLAENDQFLGRIKDLSADQRRALSADGVQLFRRQQQALTELSSGESPLPESERAILTDFAGEAGDDQAVAEEVQRDPDVAELIQSPSLALPSTATPKPSATAAPTQVQAEPVVKPTSVPPTATSVPPTATPSTVPAEVVLEPVGPVERALPTATLTATRTPIPATATSAPMPTSGPVSTQPPAAATATPTSPPPATPSPTAPEATPTATMEIVMPTLPPPQTPSP